MKIDITCPPNQPERIWIKKIVRAPCFIDKIVLGQRQCVVETDRYFYSDD